jgi:hypothetical protein
MSRRGNGAEARQADYPLSVLALLTRFLPNGLAGTVIDNLGFLRSQPRHDAYDANGNVQIKMTHGTRVAMYANC